MSYFSQMVGLCAQNFLAAGAAGLAVGVAFIRGIARQLSGHTWQLLGGFDARAAVDSACRERCWEDCWSCHKASR